MGAVGKTLRFRRAETKNVCGDVMAKVWSNISYNMNRPKTLLRNLVKTIHFLHSFPSFQPFLFTFFYTNKEKNSELNIFLDSFVLRVASLFP